MSGCVASSVNAFSAAMDTGKSLKPLPLCGSVSHGNGATAEPTGSPPYGPSPGHRSASLQPSSGGGAQAAMLHICRTCCSPQQPRGSHHLIHGTHTAPSSSQHLTLPGQCSLAPGAHPLASSCPCKPCRACSSAQHHSTGARIPHLTDHSQHLPSDRSQPNLGSVSRQ